ncbi:MAG TPA: MucB/RseB C-terminal domain-containing protein [Woeseiaceae bacterium]|nr:MucB/RseB C-terminal domain-containing protein [Woeseiaceae bacterium]
MLTHNHTTKAAACIVFCGFFTGPQLLAAEATTPQDWIDRMGNAVQVTNYEGTVVRVRDGNVDTFKVVHTVKDGVIREKVVIQDGNGLEIIRNGNEVHCILPDRESVLVEEWNNQSTLFSTLPSSDIRFGNEYDVLIKDFERVAGRKSAMLAILPHDNYRYGYRIWLDLETGFPLQTQLIGDDNQPLEHVKFADISIEQDIRSGALDPSYSTDNWKWYTEPRLTMKREVQSDWLADDVPSGFRVVSTQQKILPDVDDPLTHIVYSDGLVTVSVFIAPVSDGMEPRRSSVGASNSYSTVIDGNRITAVGQVPQITVEQIAKSMRRSQ